MSGERDDWETLNAYVDGELSPDEAAEVARRAARDPRSASRIAALSALRAALRASVEPPPRLDLAGAARRRPRALQAGAIALAAVVAVISIAFLITDRPPGELDIARDMHRQWIAQNDPRPEAEPARTLRTSLAHLGLESHVPDLSSVDLAFAHIRALPRESGRRGLHVGYLGTRGCMMSLVIIENPGGAASALHEVGDGRGNERGSGYAWQVAGYSYVLLAARMDPQRLMRVAAIVERMTRRRTQPGSREQLALRESRAGARPCIV